MMKMKGENKLENERPTNYILKNERIIEQKISNEMPIANYMRHKKLKKIREVIDNTEKNNQSKDKSIKNNKSRRYIELINENNFKKLKDNDDYLCQIFSRQILYYIIKNDMAIKSMNDFLKTRKHLKIDNLRKAYEQKRKNNIIIKNNISLRNYISIIIIRHIIINIFIQIILNNFFKFSIIIFTYVNYIEYNLAENLISVIFLYIIQYNNKIIKSFINNNRIIKKKNNINQKIENYTKNANACIKINDNTQINYRNSISEIIHKDRNNNYQLYISKLLNNINYDINWLFIFIFYFSFNNSFSFEILIYQFI